MKLTDLTPKLHPNDATFENFYLLEYHCPECFRNGKEHRIVTPRGDGEHRWKIVGASFETLTMTPSVRVVSGMCHGHWNITNGEIHLHTDSKP